MRVNSRGGGDSSFAAGFISALLVLGAVRVGVGVYQWAATTDVWAAVVAWATTPSISPLGLVVNLAPVIFIGLILFILLGYMTMFRRLVA
jgi:hypothetical protein